jgi:3-phenylpropionate/trans-cinnamate dioxygenase ferredoxin subunit
MGNIVEAAGIDELEPGQAKLIEVDGKEIALFNSNGEYFAIDNECTHVGGPLCEGEIEDGKIICPWHGAEFDLKSGQAIAPPAEEDVRTYKVHIDRDSIKIEL